MTQKPCKGKHSHGASGTRHSALASGRTNTPLSFPEDSLSKGICMDVAIAALALILLMIAAYRGMSVILMAPLLAMLAVFLTDSAAVPTVFSGVFMEKVATFLKLYFPVFLLGALFGKMVEISGFSRAIVTAVIGMVGAGRAIHIRVDDVESSPWTCPIASSTVSLPRAGRITTRSPNPAPWVTT